MTVVEAELRRMGVPEDKVSVVADRIYDAAVTSTGSIDGILSGLKMLLDLEMPLVPMLNANWLVNGKRS